MKIGIIGDGVIGAANRIGFSALGHEVVVHDIKYETSIDVVLDTELCFICVPTPSEPSGKCNTEIVRSVVELLNEKKYSGEIAIRSTCEPGFSSGLITSFPDLKISYAPEFLRERCAVHDFLENHELLAIGTESDASFELIKAAHKQIPKNVVRLTPSEAETLKYFNNVYAACRVVFANNLYEVCQRIGADYTQVKNAYAKTGKMGDFYLDVDDSMRGFGGMCLPKDTKAIKHLKDRLGIKLQLLDVILSDNEKLKTTVFSGMRDEE